MSSTLFNLTEATSLISGDAFYLVRGSDVAGNDRWFDIATLDEHIQDLMSTTIVAGSNISVVYNDAGGTLTISYTGATPPATTDDLTEGVSNLYFTNERAQDAVGNAVGVGLSYDDPSGAIFLSDMAQATVKGRAAGTGTGAPGDLSQAQLTALVNTFTNALSGSVPAASGGVDTANHALLGSGAFGQIIKTGTALLQIQGSTTTGTHAGDNEAWARVGPVVIQGFDVSWSAVDATGNLFLAGLPYAANGGFQGVFFNAFGITTSHTGTTCRVLSGNTQIDIQKIAPTTGLLSNYQDTDCPLSGPNKRIRAVGILVYTTSDAF